MLMVRELMAPREVAIKCLLLSESLPNHMILVNEESAFGDVVFAVSFEVHGVAELRNADH